jgi:hypothetical protein
MHPTTKTFATHVQVKVTVPYYAHVLIHVSTKGMAVEPFHQKLDLIQETERTGYCADDRKKKAFVKIIPSNGERRKS